MNVSLPRLFTAFAAAVLLAPAEGVSVGQPNRLPPVPFEDVGACPFEGCTYREWVAKETVVVRTDRRDKAAVAFRLQRGERVSALTGIVITVRAGRVQFREPRRLPSTGGTISIAPGQTLYLLTYQGEGFTKAWFNGRLYEQVDGSDFFDAACDDEPNRCSARIIERSKTEWWVQLRNRLGAIGWTRETEKFDGKDSLG